MKPLITATILFGICLALCPPSAADVVAGNASGDELVIAEAGSCKAVIVVSESAGPYERQAADDLAKYIEMMCGERPTIAATPQQIETALRGSQSQLVLGQEAIKANPALTDILASVLKPDPHLRTDGIVLLRQGRFVTSV